MARRGTKEVLRISAATIDPARKLVPKGAHVNSQRTCVVIEDDPDIRDLIALILAGAGFEVHAYETAHEGMTAVERLNQY